MTLLKLFMQLINLQTVESVMLCGYLIFIPVDNLPDVQNSSENTDTAIAIQET